MADSKSWVPVYIILPAIAVVAGYGAWQWYARAGYVDAETLAARSNARIAEYEALTYKDPISSKRGDPTTDYAALSPRVHVVNDEVTRTSWYYDKAVRDYTVGANKDKALDAALNKGWLRVYVGEDKDQLWLRLQIAARFDKSDYFSQVYIRADDEVLTITQSSKTLGGYTEYIDVALTPQYYDMLTAIADSDEAYIRVSGRSGPLDRKISQAEKDAITNVFGAYVALGGRLPRPKAERGVPPPK